MKIKAILASAMLALTIPTTVVNAADTKFVANKDEYVFHFDKPGYTFVEGDGYEWLTMDGTPVNTKHLIHDKGFYRMRINVTGSSLTLSEDTSRVHYASYEHLNEGTAYLLEPNTPVYTVGAEGKKVFFKVTISKGRTAKVSLTPESPKSSTKFNAEVSKKGEELMDIYSNCKRQCIELEEGTYYVSVNSTPDKWLVVSYMLNDKGGTK